MKTVYKYPIPLPDNGCKSLVHLPAYADILSVGAPNGIPMLWALVETQNPVDVKRLAVFPTGATIPWDDGLGRFLGRLDLPGGLVFHVFVVA